MDPYTTVRQCASHHMGSYRQIFTHFSPIFGPDRPSFSKNKIAEKFPWRILSTSLKSTFSLFLKKILNIFAGCYRRSVSPSLKSIFLLIFSRILSLFRYRETGLETAFCVRKNELFGQKNRSISLFFDRRKITENFSGLGVIKVHGAPK